MSESFGSRWWVKTGGWILTTLLIPVFIFGYQRFMDDFKDRQAVEAELMNLEFELAVRLGQVSSSFYNLLDNGKNWSFKSGIISDWLQVVLVELRQNSIIDITEPKTKARIIVSPASKDTKDMTILGLLAGGAFLEDRMLDFLEVGFINRVAMGGLAPKEFCKPQMDRFLKIITERYAMRSGERVNQSLLTVETWRSNRAGTLNSETACMKSAKFRDGIGALLQPDAFLDRKAGSLFEQFQFWFEKRLLWTVPDYDLPYIDKFAG